MIGNCSHCKVKAELEDWGGIKLCEKCVELYLLEIPEVPPKEDVDIKIGTADFIGAGASYEMCKTNIRISEGIDDMPKLSMWISHEIMHYLLHRMVGVKCCYKYDLISGHGELDFPQSL